MTTPPPVASPAFEACVEALNKSTNYIAMRHNLGRQAREKIRLEILKTNRELLALAEQEIPAKASLGKVSDDAQTTKEIL